CFGRALSAGNPPTIPALHWAMTRSGTETMNIGAPITGNVSRPCITAGMGMKRAPGAGRRSMWHNAPTACNRSRDRRAPEFLMIRPSRAVAPPSAELIAELVTANRIIFDQKVVDGFGHISVRHDQDPTTYLMARDIAPGLVTAADIVVFDLD